MYQNSKMHQYERGHILANRCAFVNFEGVQSFSSHEEKCPPC